MRADLLHVIAVFANPIRWKSRLAIHKGFEASMLAAGVRLTTVECAYGERPFDLTDHAGQINRVQVRAKTLVWTKENLINIGISRLPPDWKYVAWIDGDVFFRKSDWAVETVHALQQYDIVQPWSDAYDLGPKDEHLAAYKSFCRQYAEGHPVVPTTSAFWKFDKGPYDYPHCLIGDSLVVPGGDVLAASSRPFEGDIVIVRTAAGKELACTPNHPILTDIGWIPAKRLQVGDDIFRHVGGNGIFGEINEKHVPARIEDIARAFSERPRAHRSTYLLPDDFDGNRVDHKIADVWTEGLPNEAYSGCGQKLRQLAFADVIHLQAAPFDGRGSHDLLLKAFGLSFSSDKSSLAAGLSPVLDRRVFEHARADTFSNFGPNFCGSAVPEIERAGAACLTRQSLSGVLSPHFCRNSVGDKLASMPFVHADDASAFRRAFATQIERDQVVYVGRREFAGHVYDLKTKYGYILSDQIVTHNSGFCWSATRTAIEWLGGLLQTGALGAGDHHMALGLVGHASSSMPGGVSKDYAAQVMLWQQRADFHIRRNIGFIWGTIEHRWHGRKADRKYVDRWDIITRNNFQPTFDLKSNVFGVLELSGGKPQLTRDIDQYFRMRNEDASTID